MKAFINRLRKIRFTEKSVPFALLVALVLAFGLLIPWLGFYHDEWHFIYYDAILGAKGLVKLFNYDGHPLTVWFYLLSFKLLGVRPLGWHIYSLLWRWMAVSMFWLWIDRLWPGRRRFTFIAALLFAIYPIFVLQVLPISYFEVWGGFFLIFLSFFCTVQAIRQPEKFWFYTTIAIVAKFGQMLTSEYSWGIELIRPVMVWFLFSGEFTFREKIYQTIKFCIPYLIIFTGFGLWRGLLFQAGRKEIALQSGIFHAPFQTAIAWIQHGFPDLALILFASWYDVVQPTDLFLGNWRNLLILCLSILSGGAIFFYLQGLNETIETDVSKRTALRAAIVIGLVGVAVGLIPSYAAGYMVYLSAPPGNSRFALGSLPATAILISAGLEILISSGRARMVVVAVLTGLAIGWHVRYTDEFREIWRYQVDFYRQLSWRVPAIKPGTALVATSKFFSPIRYPSAILAVSGDYPTALVINTIYAGKLGKDGEIPYWFFQAPQDRAREPGLMAGQHLDSSFSSAAKQNLFFSYRPQDGQCLRILSPSDTPPPVGPGYSYITKSHPEFSLAGIDLSGQTDFGLLNKLIGPEKRDTWCFYYEKADLARQREDWPAITMLWQNVQKKHLRPEEGQEYLPFIVALAKQGHWKDAFELTHTAKKITPHGISCYCELWTRLAEETPDSASKEDAVVKIRKALGCPNPRQP
jgi:hypothetical protein